MQTCKHLQINLFVYLRDVIERVSTHPARLVLELTSRGYTSGSGWACVQLCTRNHILKRKTALRDGTRRMRIDGVHALRASWSALLNFGRSAKSYPGLFPRVDREYKHAVSVSSGHHALQLRCIGVTPSDKMRP